MILQQRKRAQVQAGSQGDAVYAGIQRSMHAHLQGLLRRVHGQLFHAVDENQTIALLGVHRAAHMHAGRVGQLLQVEFHHRLIGILDVELVLFELVLDVLGIEAAVGHGGHHRIRDMADTTEAGHFQRQCGSGNIHAHTALHDRHQFVLAQAQAEIINTFHF